MKTASVIKRIICMFVLISLFFPLKDNVAEAAYSFEGKVTASVLNVRSKPGTKYAIKGKLKKGQVVTVKDKKGTWSKVYYGKRSGWVSAKYISAVKWTGYVNATNLNVRKSPSSKSTILTSIKRGTAMTVQGKDSSWLKVYMPSKKKTGWVSASYVSKKKPTTVSKKKPIAVSTATKSPVAKAPPTAPAKPIVKERVVLKQSSNLRNGPGTSYKILSVEKAGTYFDKVGEKAGWVQIKKANGETSWVAGWLVRTPASVLKGKVFVLDPGHGGIDNGTSGKFFREKVLNLNSALEFGSLLKKAGAKVVYTRSMDIYLSLKQRVSISHLNKADAFISFHYNACKGTCNGIETFYYSNAKEGSLARSVHNNLIVQTKLKDRKAKYGNYHVLRENKQPAVLLELGFLSDPDEEKLVGTSTYKKKAAQGIYNGVFEYFLNR